MDRIGLYTAFPTLSDCCHIPTHHFRNLQLACLVVYMAVGKENEEHEPDQSVASRISCSQSGRNITVPVRSVSKCNSDEATVQQKADISCVS